MSVCGRQFRSVRVSARVRMSVGVSAWVSVGVGLSGCGRVSVLSKRASPCTATDFENGGGGKEEERRLVKKMTLAMMDAGGHNWK